MLRAYSDSGLADPARRRGGWMSQRKTPPTKAVISRRVLLAAGGLVVLGEFIAGEGSSGANDAARPSANGSKSPTPTPRAGQTTHPSSPAHPTATPRDDYSSSAAQRPPSTAETPTAQST